MRIAVPVTGDKVSKSFGTCEAFRFYEDDHGRIVRQFGTAVEESGSEAAIATLERFGVDAVVCTGLSTAEKQQLAAAGLLVAASESDDADEAALRFLGGAIAFDPENLCDYCGHKHECSMDCVRGADTMSKEQQAD